MMRHAILASWDTLILSAVVAAFEAYGSALAGITPSEPPPGNYSKASAASPQAAQRG